MSIELTVVLIAFTAAAGSLPLLWPAIGVGPVAVGFYVVGAQVLPILVLAIVVDRGLFDRLPTSTEARILAMYWGLGETASLVAVASGTSNVVSFGLLVGSLVMAMLVLYFVVVDGIGGRAGDPGSRWRKTVVGGPTSSVTRPPRMRPRAIR